MFYGTPIPQKEARLIHTKINVTEKRVKVIHFHFYFPSVSIDYCWPLFPKFWSIPSFLETFLWMQHLQTICLRIKRLFFLVFKHIREFRSMSSLRSFPQNKTKPHGMETLDSTVSAEKKGANTNCLTRSRSTLIRSMTSCKFSLFFETFFTIVSDFLEFFFFFVIGFAMQFPGPQTQTA